MYSTMHLSPDLFVFFSLLVLFFKPMQPLASSSSETKLFDLDYLPNSYLSFSGDSHIQYGTNAIVLTREGMPSDSPSTGSVLYRRPILSLNRQLKKVPSFSTMFVFFMKNNGKKEDSGDGLAFLISPDDDLLGSPGYLGLVDSTDLTRNKFIAIEFDTKRDLMFQDPDDNHLGLDINGLSSVQLATSSSLGVNLNSGNLIHTWIDYKSDEKSLEVFLSYSDLKPVKSLLKVDIDLSNYLTENMFVGFSAATKGSMQSVRVEQWKFTILEFSPPPPSPSPSPDLVRTFANPFGSGRGHSHHSWLAIGLTVRVCLVPLVVVFGWFCWEKLMGTIQKLKGENDLNMQTIRSSGGTSEIRLSIPDTNPDEVARGITIEKVLGNEAELILVKTVKFSIPLPATVCQ